TRTARFSGSTPSGLSRGSSSRRRVSGITLVARFGRSMLVSCSQAASCSARSARSRNTRPLKNEFFTHFTIASTVPFWLPLREARKLQARGEEVDALYRAVPESHVDLAEVVLRELAGETVEEHDGWRVPRSQRRDDGVERRLLTGVTLILLSATKQLLRRNR